MRTPPRTPHAAATIALLALAAIPGATLADTPAPNEGMRFVSVGAQADSQHDQEALAVVSLPVGQQAWVQAGAGKSHRAPLAGGDRPGIVTGSAGVASQALQVTLNASHRAAASSGYRQTDVGSSLEWRHGGGSLGVDVTHRRSQARGATAVSNAQGGSTLASSLVHVSGAGLGVHGTLPVGEHASLYASVMRSHYKSTQAQSDPGTADGVIGSNPGLTHALRGGSSVVNLDEVALTRSAQVGATYRWSKVAVSGEYTAGQVYDNGGSLRSVALRAAVDVAPGWRVAPGIGRGTSDQGGHANFASLSAIYGW